MRLSALLVGVGLAMTACPEAVAKVEKWYWGRPNMRQSIIELIAASADPSEFKNVEPKSLKELVIRKCGYIDEVYVSLVRKRNPRFAKVISSKLEASKKLQSVTLPACLYATREKFAYVVEQEKEWKKIALKFTGYNGPLTRERFAEINRTIDLDSLRSGQTIFVPYRSKLTKLEFDSAAALDRFTKRLQALDSAYYSAKETPPRFQQAGRSEKNPVAANAVGCESNAIMEAQAATCKAEGEGYPLRTREIRKVLHAYSLAFDPPIMNAGVVAVVDTGIDGFQRTDLNDERSYPETFSKSDMFVYSVEGYPSVGTTFSDLGDQFRPAPLKSESYPWYHGTFVAGLVAGKTLESTLRKDLSGRIKLVAFNAVEKTGLCFGLSSQFMSSGTDLALKLPPPGAVKVVNLSLASPNRNPLMASALRSTQSLFVIAAGNTKLNLDDDESYPASFAVGSRNSLVVAAHDAKRHIVKPTAVGSRAVHIAAPGCGISSLSGDKLSTLKTAHGTSAAAAFVSFTAAVILSSNSYRDAGNALTAEDIKTRILLTADRDLKDAESVRDNAVLNAHKAMAVDFDIVEEEVEAGPVLHYGAITHESNFFNACVNINLEKLARLDLKPNGDGTTNVSIEYKGDDRAVKRNCSVGGDIVFGEWGEDQKLVKRQIPLSHIRQIIPAKFNSSRNAQRERGER